jgi:hypothetical protein
MATCSRDGLICFLLLCCTAPLDRAILGAAADERVNGATDHREDDCFIDLCGERGWAASPERRRTNARGLWGFTFDLSGLPEPRLRALTLAVETENRSRERRRRRLSGGERWPDEDEGEMIYARDAQAPPLISAALGLSRAEGGYGAGGKKKEADGSGDEPHPRAQEHPASSSSGDLSHHEAAYHAGNATFGGLASPPAAAVRRATVLRSSNTAGREGAAATPLDQERSVAVRPPTRLRGMDGKWTFAPGRGWFDDESRRKGVARGKEGTASSRHRGNHYPTASSSTISYSTAESDRWAPRVSVVVPPQYQAGAITPPRSTAAPAAGRPPDHPQAAARRLGAVNLTAQWLSLRALFNQTGGASAWVNSSGWDSGEEGTECRWFGVTCDYSTNAVVALRLRNNGLVGAVTSAATAGLGDLVALDLHGNACRVALAGLSPLTRLAHVDLAGGGNRILDTLSDLSDCTALTFLELSSCGLAGTLDTLAQCTALSYLGVGGASGLFDGEAEVVDQLLTGDVRALAGLTNLTHLALGKSPGITGDISFIQKSELGPIHPLSR